MSKPVDVTLRFRSKEERDYFMGQLSDGWGENQCYLRWRGSFDRARVFQVDPTMDGESELWDHYCEMKARRYDRVR